jgi:putative restriction endonuclease
VLGWVANTDRDWFETLRARPHLREVNFWQPASQQSFRIIGAGQFFFFRLKSPISAIGGFGVYAEHALLPAWHVWDTFGEGNGAVSEEEFRRRIERYRRRDRGSTAVKTPDYLVGCLLLTDPVFFADANLVDEPAGWPPNVVRGKSYELTSGEGARMLRDCLDRVPPDGPPDLVDAKATLDLLGTPRLVAPRLGQGTFRISVERAYGRACAVTGEHSLPVLEAAHIRPFREGGHSVTNGLLLRRDIHRLFDLGYVTVTPDARFRVSGALRDEWANGRTYYALNRSSVRLPHSPSERPDLRHLEWHNDEVFRG